MWILSHFAISLLGGWGTPRRSVDTAWGLLEVWEECVGSTWLLSVRGHWGLTVKLTTELSERGKG